MTATTNQRNGHQHTPPPPSLTAEQCFRVLVKQMLREKGLRAVLKIVKEEFGYPLEIQYKV